MFCGSGGLVGIMVLSMPSLPSLRRPAPSVCARGAPLRFGQRETQERNLLPTSPWFWLVCPGMAVLGFWLRYGGLKQVRLAREDAAIGVERDIPNPRKQARTD